MSDEGPSTFSCVVICGLCALLAFTLMGLSTAIYEGRDYEERRITQLECAIGLRPPVRPDYTILIDNARERAAYKSAGRCLECHNYKDHP